LEARKTKLEKIFLHLSSGQKRLSLHNDFELRGSGVPRVWDFLVDMPFTLTVAKTSANDTKLIKSVKLQGEVIDLYVDRFLDDFVLAPRPTFTNGRIGIGAAAKGLKSGYLGPSYLDIYLKDEKTIVADFYPNHDANSLIRRLIPKIGDGSGDLFEKGATVVKFGFQSNKFKGGTWIHVIVPGDTGLELTRFCRYLS